MDYLNCFICNAETKLENSVRIRTKTKYSGIGVHGILQSFVKESKRLSFSPNDIVCEQCFQKVNQYDLACRMADDIQQEITNALYSTEQEYLSEEVEYFEESLCDKQSRVLLTADFEEFQEKYDVQYSQEKSDENDDVVISNITDDVVVEVFEPSSTDEATEQKKRKMLTRCEICYTSLHTKRDLEQHQLRYHTLKKCGVCQVVLKNLFEFKEHMRKMHLIEHGSNDETETSDRDGPAVKTDFRCEICGMSESTKKSLSKHIALHDNQLKCVICGAILKHKANLVLHMRIHTDKHFFKCDKCEKTFVHKSSLRMHLQTTHTEIRNKQCSECPLKFKTTSQLNQHLVTHSGVRNHKCPVCQKAFGQKYNMTAHYKNHFAQESKQARAKAVPKSSIKVEMEL
ncbi:zinc finger protein 184-like [Contarinia nasturtii]|uniref:zinc finger protein 184-like n=1 Tax=Contarinia nasturtii TaxID=265458 RepID=UPI0012D42140|nr:zinc finger protein 184-like [Contarinia nasturtii]